MKWIVPSIIICAIATGCTANKKGTTQPGMAKAPGAAEAPVANTAPAAQFTPAAPQQPVIADPPQQATASVADAPSDDVTSSAPPQRQSGPAKNRAVAKAGTRYKIKNGETLWSIAQSHYGNGQKWKTIAAANPKLDPNHIEAGQTIILP